MLTDRELLALHTKLALMWIFFGIVIGATGCWFVVGPGKRPVVELRINESPPAVSRTP